MSKRKALTPSNHGRNDDFIRGSIYRTTHRKYAVIGRDKCRSTENRSNKKRRTTKPNNDSSSKKKKTYFASNPNDPGLMRLQGISVSKTSFSSPQFTITPALPSKAKRGGFKPFLKTCKNTVPSLLVGENKFLFLVEGISRETGSRYDYLSEIYMHGVVDALPTHGCSTEILPIPMTPGRWETEDVGCTASTIQNQDDWEGKRVVLRHEHYDPQKRANLKHQFRMTRVDRPHIGDIGSVSLVAFDGFGSSEERLYNQSELGMTVQKMCRSQQWTSQPIVLLPPFQHGCWSSSGGVSAAVRMGSEGLGTYYLKITSCEKSNQLVAAEIVFRCLGANYTNTESVCTSPSTAPLTVRNLKHHVVKTQHLPNPKEMLDRQTNQVQTKTPEKTICSDAVKSWTPSDGQVAPSNGIHPLGVEPKVLNSPSTAAHKNNSSFSPHHESPAREMQNAFSPNASGSSLYGSAKQNPVKDHNSKWEDHELSDVFFDPLSPSRYMEDRRDNSLHVHAHAEVKEAPNEDRASSVFFPLTSNAHEHEHASANSEVASVVAGEDELPSRVCLHDVLFGIQEDDIDDGLDTQEATSIATDWTVGAILMLLFALLVRFFLPVLLELIEANSAPVLPDLDAILHAGEGFAEFVYVP